MTVYLDKRRRGVWRYDFRLAGKRHAGDCAGANSRRAALAAEAEARARAAIAPKLPAPGAVTLAMIAEMMAGHWDRCRTADDTRCHVRDLLAYFGPSTPVQQIGRREIDAYIDWALAQPARHCAGRRGTAAPIARTRSPATVNIYLVPLRQMLARAHALRDPLTGARVLDYVPDVPRLKIPRRIPRPVPDAVIGRLYDLLPPHVAEAMRLTLYFGLRAEEAFGLQIQHIDQTAGVLRLPAETVKAGRDQFVKGGAAAMAFLAALEAQARARGVPWLIAWRRGKDGSWCRMASPKRAWADAMDTIAAETGQRWRWHDLRAAYISRLAVAVPGRVVQQMARHVDFSTTQRYIAVTDSAIADAAEIASRLAAGDRQDSSANVPHQIPTPIKSKGSKHPRKQSQLTVIK